ncbi:hypothetical protein DFA_02681 [Cavenderia fasciculata]|uniref:Uncharacterized protein n=1 Tax=Cavenderia fasciculata TaxID=261658 RepID=F4Q027_CACFS|nr:uncharacterized protein DFA_02681 [Cavenderia fasciculata]EGG18941.1 hypothetical protein DFA_02681 [Cavenderia fasciculata]|eukprot:XP_004357403.1 hypothetical protein DFA_02681 [Cavenderia fasciculata]
MSEDDDEQGFRIYSEDELNSKLKKELLLICQSLNYSQKPNQGVRYTKIVLQVSIVQIMTIFLYKLINSDLDCQVHASDYLNMFQNI